ncbi:MAG: hypothetical protein WD079_03845, partial [Phycisphaeraceae bacterium]
MNRLIKFRLLSALLALMLLLVACGSDDAADDDMGDDADDTATDDVADDDTDAGDDDMGDDAADDSDDAGDDAAADGDFDPETYFEGKTIRFVTSSGPGGGTDTKIRTLASQLPRFMPGNPATQVSNVTPHVAGINFLWEAEPDGLTVGMTAAPPLEFEFFEGATWTTPDFEHIGAIDSQCDNMLLMLGELPYDSIEDVMGSDGPPLITMTSAPTPADVEPVQLSTMLIADYLDLPLEVRRVAESGTSALTLALERGEINFARFGSDWCRIPQANPGWLEDGFVVPLLDVGTSGPAQMAEGVEERGERPPHVSELLTEEQMDQWTGLVAASRAG